MLTPEREEKIRFLVRYSGPLPHLDSQKVILELLAEIDRLKSENTKLNLIAETSISAAEDRAKKLAVAVEVLERLETVCSMKNGALIKEGVKKHVRQALFQIRGEKQG